MIPEPEWSGRWRWCFAAVLALSVVARLAVIVPGFGQLNDPDNYLVVARSLAERRGLALTGGPTAYRPPLYPILLAPLVAVLGDRLAWGVAGLHVALGAATVALTVVTATRWGMTPARVLVAAAIVALDPVLVAQGRAVMTETLAAFLVAATVAALAEGGCRGTFLGGIGFGLSALCRPSLLPGAALAVVAALFVEPGSARVRIRRGAILALTTVAMLSPWALRNAWVLGEPVWTTTHGGWTLTLANNPVYYAEVLDGPPGAVWSGVNQQRWVDATTLAVSGAPEPEIDRRLRAIGLRFILEHPRDFLRSSFARLGRFWGIAPSPSVYGRRTRMILSVWTVPLWIALVLGLTRRSLWRWPCVNAPAIILALTVVHSVYWTDMRMRAPIVPAIALIAARASTSRVRDP